MTWFKNVWKVRIIVKQILLILALFLTTEFLGLYVGMQYIGLISMGSIVPAFENPNSIETPLFLFGNIIVATVAILIMIRISKNSIRVLEGFVIFVSSWLTFDVLIPVDLWYVSLGFILAALLVIWKIIRPTILNQNIAAVISGAGVGSLIGASLGIIPAMIFMLILSVYDFVAVFVTKHMVHMAKALTQRPTSFTIAAPPSIKSMAYSNVKRRGSKKFHVFQLGVGDMVIPLMFAVSVLSRYSIANSVASIAGSAIALLALIYYVGKNPRPLPALPFITFGALAGFLVSLGL